VRFVGNILDRSVQKVRSLTDRRATDTVKSEQDPEFAGYTRDGS
jgi:hypothetical protein